MTSEKIKEIAKDIPEIMELAVIIHPNYRGKGFAKAVLR